VRGCAFNTNLLTGVKHHALLRKARNGVDAFQELWEQANPSATPSRTHKKLDRQATELHAALVTIHDGLEQNNCPGAGTETISYSKHDEVKQWKRPQTRSPMQTNSPMRY